MGFYGVIKENSLIDSFDIEMENFNKLVDSLNILNENGIILELSIGDIKKKIKDFIDGFINWATKIFIQVQAFIFKNTIIKETKELMNNTKILSTDNNFDLYKFKSKNDKSIKDIFTPLIEQWENNIYVELFVSDKNRIDELAKNAVAMKEEIEKKRKKFLDQVKSYNFTIGKDKEDVQTITTNKFSEFKEYQTFTIKQIEECDPVVKKYQGRIDTFKKQYNTVMSKNVDYSTLLQRVKDDIGTLRETVLFLYRVVAMQINILRKNNVAFKKALKEEKSDGSL